MKIAFYAPMKPPDDPEPSGDRRVARLLWRALDTNQQDVFLASRFRSWDGSGDTRRQQRLQRIGKHRAHNLVSLFRQRPPEERPAAWVTYHLYHKAPDWIGPTVTTALDIPYLVVEASHAGKQQNRRWSLGYAAAADAIQKADTVVALNSNDLPGINRLRDEGVILMRPFIELPQLPSKPLATELRARLAEQHDISPDQPWLITVAMMREMSKLSSFRLLAKALETVSDRPWTLIVIGDGPARSQVFESFTALPKQRVHFLGELGSDHIDRWLSASDLLVWPAVGEAYGMALLEAHACGVPVIAGRSGGVADIVEHGQTGLLVEHDATAFGNALRFLLNNPNRCAQMGRQARRKAQTLHDVATARGTLQELINQAVARRSAQRSRVSARGNISLG
jgi:glycosyltransferase involved in cell wall biosynthesis